jgi:hypothetical protein
MLDMDDKNRKTPKMKLKILLILICLSIEMQSQVLWYGDPEKSINSVFRRFDAGNYPQDVCPGGDGSAVSYAGTVIDSDYGKVWRIYKPQKRKRCEFARTSFIPSENDTLYYGWRWKIESVPAITNGIAVFQWKTDAGGQAGNTQNYPLNLVYENGTLLLNIYDPCYPEWNSCGGSINDGKITRWSKPVLQGEWVSIVIKIKLSREKDLGEVALWFNGVQQNFTNMSAKRYSINLSPDKTTAYHKTFDGLVTYPKWGAYNSASCDYEVYTYFDEMRIGKSLTSVLNFLDMNANPSIIENKHISQIQIFPNPSINGMFYLSEESDFNVCTLLGHLILSSEGKLIDLSTSPKGVYVVKIGSSYFQLLCI